MIRDRCRRTILDLLQRPRRQHISRNVNQLQDEQSTVGDRLGEMLARAGGSWTFIVVIGAILALWMGVNSLQLLISPFDPSPFIFLTLLQSGLAALQAPIVLMIVNRQAARASLWTLTMRAT
jgi:uncharacterized membrane protein